MKHGKSVKASANELSATKKTKKLKQELDSYMAKAGSRIEKRLKMMKVHDPLFESKKLGLGIRPSTATAKQQSDAPESKSVRPSVSPTRGPKMSILRSKSKSVAIKEINNLSQEVNPFDSEQNRVAYN